MFVCAEGGLVRSGRWQVELKKKADSAIFHVKPTTGTWQGGGGVTLSGSAEPALNDFRVRCRLICKSGVRPSELSPEAGSSNPLSLQTLE